MSEKRFVCIDVGYGDDWYITDNGERLSEMEIVDLLNKQQATISKLEEEKGYWKSKAITLLSQVCRLTPKMSAKEVIEFGKELEDE